MGAPPQKEETEPFEDKMKGLVNELFQHQAEGARLDAAIKENLELLGFRDLIK